MKKVIVFAIFVIAFLGLSQQSVAAAGNVGYGQYGQYGAPAPQQKILIDKTVATGSETKGAVQTFVDNLSPSDPRFTPGDVVTFQLKIKNTADALLDNVEVTDILTPSVELVSGASLRTDGTAVIKVGSLAPNEEKSFTLKVRVKSQDKLPQDKGIICEVNKAKVSANGASDEDSAQFCIEKQVVGVKQVPSTGPELGIVLFAGELATLTAGIYLKRKTS